MKLLCTSPKAFLRSSKVKTRGRCLVRVLFIIFAIIEICSRTLAILGVKPFWISASLTPFCVRKEKIESRKQEVKTFGETGLERREYKKRMLELWISLSE